MEDLESLMEWYLDLASVVKLHLDPKVDLHPELKVHADAMAIHNILALLVWKLEIVWLKYPYILPVADPGAMLIQEIVDVQMHCQHYTYQGAIFQFKHVWDLVLCQVLVKEMFIIIYEIQFSIL